MVQDAMGNNTMDEKKKLMGKQTSNILQLEHGIDGFGEYCDKIDD